MDDADGRRGRLVAARQEGESAVGVLQQDLLDRRAGAVEQAVEALAAWDVVRVPLP